MRFPALRPVAASLLALAACTPEKPERGPSSLEETASHWSIEDSGEGGADATPPQTWWFPDADGDGWGDAAAPVAACGAGQGISAEDSDCDDSGANLT